MNDVLFRCPECTKSLAIDVEGGGSTIACTDCGARITVPAADLSFKCPSCGKRLWACDDVKGSNFQCPHCKEEISVPAISSPPRADWRVDVGAPTEPAATERPPTRRIRLPGTSPLAQAVRIWGVVLLLLLLASGVACCALVRTGSFRMPEVLGGRSEADEDRDHTGYRAVVAAYEACDSQVDRPEILRQYLRAFPNGLHREDINRLLAREDDQLFDYVRTRYALTLSRASRIAMARLYLKRYPNGKHAGAARALIDQALSEVSEREPRLPSPGPVAPSAPSRPVPSTTVPGASVPPTAGVVPDTAARAAPDPRDVADEPDRDWIEPVVERQKPAEPDPPAAPAAPRSRPYDSRRASVRQRLLAEYGGGAETEAAVLRALRWLKEYQEPDGSWRSTSSGCDGFAGGAAPAMTGLALLTFLSHGETTDSLEFSEAVGNGINWLAKNQEGNGRFRGRDPNNYCHGIATFALCEAYGMTHRRDAGEAAAKALPVIVDGQSGKGLWGYHVRSGQDTCFSGWCIQALAAAKVARLGVDGLAEAMSGAVEGLKRNAHRNGGFGYRSRQPSPLTGVGVMCMQLLGAAKEPAVVQGLTWLGDNATLDWRRPYGASPVYYWHHATQANFWAGGEIWKKWNARLREQLLENQFILKGAVRDRDGNRQDAGYWRSPSTSEAEYGRVFDTALCALMLQSYYRYPPVP